MASHYSSPTELYDLLGTKFGGRWVVAAGIAWAESKGDPNAKSPNPDGGENRGLFQIDTKTAAANGLDPAKLFDPQYNAYAAKVISHNGTNWHPWATAYSDPHNRSTYMSGDSPAAKAAKDAHLPGAENAWGQAVEAVAAAPGAVKDAVDSVPKFLSKLSVVFDGTWWLRVGQIALGVIAMAMALSMFGKQFMPDNMPLPIPI